jgi:hypothetical protein
MLQQSLALQSQRDAAARPDHQRLLQDDLQSLDLLAQSRLRPADPVSGPAHDTCFGDGGKVSQQVDIELGTHGY